MKLIVISNLSSVPHEAEMINALFEEGLEVLHLRKPDDSIDDVRRILSGIRPEFMDRIAIHQYHQIAGEFGIRRLHYQEALRQATKTLPSGFVLSTSIHKLEEFPEVDGKFEYCFFGPVFQSITKPGYGPAFSQLPALPENRTTLLIANGGITADNMGTALDHGFDAVAVLGSVWTPGVTITEAIKNFKTLNALCLH